MRASARLPKSERMSPHSRKGKLSLQKSERAEALRQERKLSGHYTDNVNVLSPASAVVNITLLATARYPAPSRGVSLPTDQRVSRKAAES